MTVPLRMAHHQPQSNKLAHPHLLPSLPPHSHPSPLPLPATPELSAPLAATSTPTIGAATLLVTASPTTPALSTSPAPPVVTFAPGPPPPNPVTLVPQPLPQPSHSKWRVTPAQKEVLLKAFDEQPYPELQKKNTLARQLGVTTPQISKWFQHRREHLTRLGQFKAQYNRTRRTPEELDVLQAAFDAERYPNSERLQQLAAQLQSVTPKQIKLWFKHRRKQDQKRKRANSSPISLRSSASLPDHSAYPSLPSMHPPDVSSSSQDPMRSEWRQNIPANLVPNVQQAPPIQQVPPLQQCPPLQPVQQIPPVPPTALMQAPPNPTVPYTFDPHGYYPYNKSQFLVASQSSFSKMEHLALQAAYAVLNATPPPDAIVRIAQLLNRPYDAVRDWFRAQENCPNPLVDS